MLLLRYNCKNITYGDMPSGKYRITKDIWYYISAYDTPIFYMSTEFLIK